MMMLIVLIWIKPTIVARQLPNSVTSLPEFSDKGDYFMPGYRALEAQDYKAATRHFKRFVDQEEAMRDNVGLALGLAYLAPALEEAGDTAEAQACYRRALALAVADRTVSAGIESWATHGLARCYIRAGKFLDAEPLLRRHLAYWDHPPAAEASQSRYNRATGLANLAKIKTELNHVPDAIGLYEQSIAILQGMRRPESQPLAGVLEGYARALRKSGRAAQAETLEVRAQSVRLGDVEEKVKRLETKAENASQWAARVRKLAREKRGQDIGRMAEQMVTSAEDDSIRCTQHLARVLRDYAALLRRAGRDPEAEKAEARGRSISKEVLEEPDERPKGTERPK